MMNKKIIAELNKLIDDYKDGFAKYRIDSFLINVNKIEKIITFIKTKDYDFLSTEEAIACSSTHI